MHLLLTASASNWRTLVSKLSSRQVLEMALYTEREVAPAVLPVYQNCMGSLHLTCGWCARAGEMQALLPVVSTMLKFSPAERQRCHDFAARWEAAAGGQLPTCTGYEAPALSPPHHAMTCVSCLQHNSAMQPGMPFIAASRKCKFCKFCIQFFLLHSISQILQSQFCELCEFCKVNSANSILQTQFSKFCNFNSFFSKHCVWMDSATATSASWSRMTAIRHGTQPWSCTLGCRCGSTPGGGRAAR